jgi:hypothetical protein
MLRSLMSKRPRGDGTARIIRNAVGGMKVLRICADAISAKASSGSNLSKRRATTGMPWWRLGSSTSSRPPAQAQSAGVQKRSPLLGNG